MSVNRTDPTIRSNYLSFPYVVKTTKWQETAAKVAAIICHVLAGIVTLGIFSIVVFLNYFEHESRDAITVPYHYDEEVSRRFTETILARDRMRAQEVDII